MLHDDFVIWRQAGAAALFVGTAYAIALANASLVSKVLKVGPQRAARMCHMHRMYVQQATILEKRVLLNSTRVRICPK